MRRGAGESRGIEWMNEGWKESGKKGGKNGKRKVHEREEDLIIIREKF